MKWQDYCKMASRTESIVKAYFLDMRPEVGFPVSEMEWEPHIQITRLLHASLGLTTELKEFRDAQASLDIKNQIEELGDLPWYLAVIYNLLPYGAQIEVTKYVEPKEGLDPEFYVAQIADIAKRVVFYGTDMHTPSKHYPDGMLVALVDCVTKLLCWVDETARLLNINVVEVWEANIKKLEKRYPDLSFNAEQAIVRDIENELSHMDKLAEDAADAQLIKERREKPTIRVADVDIFFESIAKETDERLKDMGPVITFDFFKTTVFNELQWNEIPTKFADWALVLSNSYRERGCDALAEGFKHIYVKLLAIKGIDLEAKANAVMKDGWGLFHMMYNRPRYEGELVQWLLSKRSVI